MVSIGGSDPNYLVEDNGKLFRRICRDTKGRWAHLNYFVHTPQFRELMNRHWVVEHDFSNEMTVGGEHYIPVQWIPHFSPPNMWTQAQQIEALKLIARINLFLEPTGWQAADCHLDNVTFLYGDPIYVDTGSFSFNQQAMAFNHFSLAGKYAGLNLPQSWKESIDVLERFKPVYPATEWDVYDPRTAPANVNDIKPSTQEQALILSWLKGTKTVMDLGSNRGLFSRLMAVAGMEVVAVDISPSCTDANWMTARRLNLPITSLCCAFSDMIQKSQWHQKALTCGTVLASSLTHHLFRSGLNWWGQENVFRQFASDNLLIEYISSADPAIVAWNLHGRYDQTMFESAFSDWEILETSQPESATRTWYRLRKN